MSENLGKHSPMWMNFIGGSFIAAILLLGIGIYHLPVNLWTKGYLAMGGVIAIHTAISLTKTIRDNEESKKLYKKVDDAKSDKLVVDQAGN